MATAQSNVRYGVQDSAAIVRFDRPERRNAFTFRTIEEIRAAVVRAPNDDRAIGIIITGGTSLDQNL